MLQPGGPGHTEDQDEHAEGLHHGERGEAAWNPARPPLKTGDTHQSGGRSNRPSRRPPVSGSDNRIASLRWATAAIVHATQESTPDVAPSHMP